MSAFNPNPQNLGEPIEIDPADGFGLFEFGLDTPDVLARPSEDVSKIDLLPSETPQDERAIDPDSEEVFEPDGQLNGTRFGERFFNDRSIGGERKILSIPEMVFVILLSLKFFQKKRVN